MPAISELLSERDRQLLEELATGTDPETAPEKPGVSGVSECVTGVSADG